MTEQTLGEAIEAIQQQLKPKPYRVVLEHYSVKCGTCGRGMFGEQHWFEAPHIIVMCRDQDCPDSWKQYKLPITRLELEPYTPPDESLTKSV